MIDWINSHAGLIVLVWPPRALEQNLWITQICVIPLDTGSKSVHFSHRRKKCGATATHFISPPGEILGGLSISRIARRAPYAPTSP